MMIISDQRIRDLSAQTESVVQPTYRKTRYGRPWTNANLFLALPQKIRVCYEKSERSEVLPSVLHLSGMELGRVRASTHSGCGRMPALLRGHIGGQTGEVGGQTGEGGHGSGRCAVYPGKRRVARELPLAVLPARSIRRLSPRAPIDVLPIDRDSVDHLAATPHPQAIRLGHLNPEGFFLT